MGKLSKLLNFSRKKLIEARISYTLGIFSKAVSNLQQINADIDDMITNNEKEMMEYEKKIYDKTKESEAVRKKYISNSLVIDKIKDLVNL
jgi:hypothetical protein